MDTDITRLISKTMEEYLKNILEVNKYINLTRISDYEEAKILLLEDSLAVLDEINEAPNGLYGDLGSGGGFPGVPLGIATNRETILIDSVSKKMNAVSEILDDLDIFNITTSDKRIEEISIDMPNKFSVLTAKGLAKIPSLLELSSPLLKQKGQLIALKSHEEEIFDNPDLENKLGMRLIREREYKLSMKDFYRKVFVFEKYKEPEVSLPRRIGLAQKRPYK